MSRYRGPGLLTMLMQSAMQDADNNAAARRQADQQVRQSQIAQLNALFNNSAQYGDAVSDELTEYGKKWGAPVEALRAQQPEVFNRVAVHPRTAWFAERGQSTPEEMLNAGGYKDFNRAMSSNPEAFQQALMSQVALQGMATPGGQEALGALGNKVPDASSVFQAPGGLMNALIRGTQAQDTREHGQAIGLQNNATANAMKRARDLAALGGNESGNAGLSPNDKVKAINNIMEAVEAAGDSAVQQYISSKKDYLGNLPPEAEAQLPEIREMAKRQVFRNYAVAYESAGLDLSGAFNSLFQNNERGQSTGSPVETGYDEAIEEKISRLMERTGNSREDIVKALRERGLLK